jgi:hypothetical protein
MSNTITIELCKEDRQRLDEVIGFLGWIASELKSRPAAATETTAPQPAQDTPAPDITHPADVVSPHGTPEPVAEPEPEAPKWTKADLTAKVQQLAAPGTGKREKVRAIVKSYAEKVGDIPEDKYAEVMDKLTALEQED